MSRRDANRLTMHSNALSASGTARTAEAQPLLGPRPNNAGRARDGWAEDDGGGGGGEGDEDADDREKHILRLLPVAFAAALALTATGLSGAVVYDRLACPDGRDCDSPPGRLEYDRLLAAVRTVAHACGVLAVGLARVGVASDPRLCLHLWLAGRALGICVLLLGCKRHPSLPGF